MEQEKRTDKYKKKTLGGFYAEIRRWDYRGKSSIEVKAMVDDMRKAIVHQLVRIKRHKYVIELLKEQDRTRVLLAQKKGLKQTTQKVRHQKNLLKEKIERREEKIEVLDQEVEQLEKSLKEQEKQIAKLHRELDKKDDLVSELRTKKRKGYTKVVKQTLSPEAKKLEKLASKGVDPKTISNLEYVIRTASFVKSKGITVDWLSLIARTEILGNVKSSDVGASWQLLNKLTELGYLSSAGGLKGAAKYWFISQQGKQLLKDYKNYLSYAKSILL